MASQMAWVPLIWRLQESNTMSHDHLTCLFLNTHPHRNTQIGLRHRPLHQDSPSPKSITPPKPPGPPWGRGLTGGGTIPMGRWVGRRRVPIGGDLRAGGPAESMGRAHDAASKGRRGPMCPGSSGVFRRRRGRPGLDDGVDDRDR